VECHTIAFRNATQEASANNVVAHLDFVSDTHETISVNEGWWGEDGERPRTSVPFYISTAQTQHLVVSCTWQEECYVIEKRYMSRGATDLPDLQPLPQGDWKVRIHLTCKGWDGRFYLSSKVGPRGESNWTEPTATAPIGWIELFPA
jgi:hypothetical protein